MAPTGQNILSPETDAAELAALEARLAQLPDLDATPALAAQLADLDAR